MGIKFDVFLKRTGQSLADWLVANHVDRVEEFQPRCAYVGLTPSAVDVAEVEHVLNCRKASEQLVAEIDREILDVISLTPASHVTAIDDPPRAPRLRKKKPSVETE